MAAAFALVRAGGRRGPVAAAMALGRRGLGGAGAPLPLMRRSLASGNGAGGTGAGGHGAGSSGCTGMANSGGCGGETEIQRLREEAFEETRRLWGGLHRLHEADRKLLEELTSIQMENALNQVKAKEKLVSNTYKVLGCAMLLFVGGAASMGPYIQRSIVHDTVKEVEKRLQR